MNQIIISGFADEISPMLDRQLEAVTGMGMQFICLRTADGKSIADYTAEEAEKQLLPRLRRAGVGVSSLGSPIGKVEITDDEGFRQQLLQLEELCKICGILGTRFIRIFSFYLPDGADPDKYRDTVMDRLRRFAAIAETHGVILLHENEKGIYGDTGRRCLDLLETVHSPNLAAAFDFANFVQCGEDPSACWELLKGCVRYFHIKDALAGKNENVLCGTGDGKIRTILADAIRRQHYRGFLTLEPHLVLFDSLASLEKAAAEDVIRVNKYSSGEEGYAAQYHALTELLHKIENEEEAEL